MQARAALEARKRAAADDRTASAKSKFAASLSETNRLMNIVSARWHTSLPCPWLAVGVLALDFLAWRWYCVPPSLVAACHDGGAVATFATQDPAEQARLDALLATSFAFASAAKDNGSGATGLPLTTYQDHFRDMLTPE